VKAREELEGKKKRGGGRTFRQGRKQWTRLGVKTLQTLKTGVQKKKVDWEGDEKNAGTQSRKLNIRKKEKLRKMESTRIRVKRGKAGQANTLRSKKKKWRAW